MRPAQTIMSAYYRRRGEDRVTEVFGAVLSASWEWLNALVERVGLPPVENYDVQTQVTAGNVTIDLEISGSAADGTPAWILWSEHKVNDPLSARQLRTEWDALKLRSGALRCQLIAITLFAPTPGAVSFASGAGFPLLRWRDISDLARRVVDMPRSGTQISQPPSVADYFLGEWLAFASNELEDPLEALTPECVEWMPEVDKAIETVAHFLETGFSRACEEIGASKPREDHDELHANPPKGSWLEDRGFKLFAKFVSNGGFGHVEGPCLVTGGWIDGDSAVSARRSRELHRALGERGLAIWDEDDRRGGWIEFGLPLSLRELSSHGSFKEQNRVAEDASLHALQALALPLA